MKIAVTIHSATLGAESFTVIRPARPVPRAVLLDRDRYLDVHLDQAAAYAVAGLWELAASSPRSLIHLPLRGNRTPEALQLEGLSRKLDLLLLHHSLQFPPSRWKEVRARLDRGHPRTVVLPDIRRAPGEVIDARARHHKENRDLFHQRLHADTLFMTGSAKLFRETTPYFLDVARQGPAATRTRPDPAHYCTELHSDAGLLARSARELHIVHCDRWDGSRWDGDR
ncbi:hypothetical protein [Streptomyces sp. NPDC048111]|uniref:hypothetical protein n=1 Tax=Streptomyces sp. NPDC048111 TaxID=3365500 RepID=UPI0037203202